MELGDPLGIENLLFELINHKTINERRIPCVFKEVVRSELLRLINEGNTIQIDNHIGKEFLLILSTKAKRMLAMSEKANIPRYPKCI